MKNQSNVLSSRNNETYLLAENRFGKTMQKIIAMEEFGELISAISKSIRDGSNVSMIEEIADALIMLEQLYMYLSDAETDAVNGYYDLKINRLKNLIK